MIEQQELLCPRQQFVTKNTLPDLLGSPSQKLLSLALSEASVFQLGEDVLMLPGPGVLPIRHSNNKIRSQFQLPADKIENW